MHDLTERSAPPTSRRWPLPRVALVCGALALASLVLPAANGYDPWAWLVWGREVTRGTLDTTGGPSWKPLPVVGTSLLAPFGSAAPTLWLLVTRTLGLMAVAFTWRLAVRYAGAAAGALAVAFLLVSPDPDPRFVRLLLEGHTGIVSVTLVLWAFERHLDRRWSHALLLGTALALLRPEAWPFLGAYAVWMWFAAPRERPLIAGSIASIPVLWFAFDWWGSGSPWHGADAAQVAFRDATNRTELAVRRAVEAVVVPAWIAAGIGVATAVRRREIALVVAGAAALVWSVMVVAMTIVFHYAALSRFFLPSVGLVCVLAGIGAVRAIGALPPGAARIVATVVVAVAVIASLVPRAAGIPDVMDQVRDQAAVEDSLVAIVEEVGVDALLSCPAVSVDGWGGMRPAVAWHLDVPLHELGYGPLDGAGIVLARPDSRRDADLTLATEPEVAVVARNDRWIVYGVDCEPGAPAS